ncbi:MAG: MFS transporter [Candidatus Helarchaeota archaeon]
MTFIAGWLGVTSIFFTYLNNLSLGYQYIGFIILGVLIACFLWIKLHEVILRTKIFCMIGLIQCLLIIGLVFIKEVWYIVVSFLCLGFCVLFIFICNIYYIKRETEIANRGRSIGLLLFFLGLFGVIIIFPLILYPMDQLFLIVSILGGVNFLLILIFYRKASLIEFRKTDQTYSITLEVRDLLYYFNAIFMFTLIMGICNWQIIASSIPHYLAIEAGRIFFGDYANTVTGMESGNFYMLLSLIIFSYPSGRLIDRLGRREGFVIGLLFTAISLFFLAFFLSVMTVILVWLCIGVSFSLILNSIICLITDLTGRSSTLFSSISMIGFFGGLSAGFFIGLTTVSLPFAYVTLIILMAVPVSLFTLFYAKDTLPSAEEIKWRSSILEFFCVYSNGICIARHPFKEQTKIDADLFAGGISGIVLLVQEMIKTDKKTKIIDQEEKKLLFEFGDYVTCILLTKADLKVLRKKLELVTREIEYFFKDVFPVWSGDVEVFTPIKSIVQRHFM